MNRYYKRYLPYIIFFSTILVGTVTMLTAVQLRKPTQEQPVTSTPSKADEGFNDVGESDADITMKECTTNECTEFTGNEVELTIDMSNTRYTESGEYSVDVTVDYKEDNGMPGFGGNLVWYLFYANKDDNGNYDPSSCNRPMDEHDQSEVVQIRNGDSITVDFTVPEDQRWCGCFQFDANLSQMTTDDGKRWQRDTGSGDVGGWVTGLGGVCEQEPLVCGDPCTEQGECGAGFTCYQPNGVDGVCRNIACVEESDCSCDVVPQSCGGECTNNNQCESGLSCILGNDGNGLCRNPNCTGDADCVCDLHACGERCEADSECQQGLVCFASGVEDKFCRNPACTGDGDCVCDQSCPVILPAEPVVSESRWQNNDASSNVILMGWKDFQGETKYELYLISDGTLQNPTEGSYYLMKDSRGAPLPFATVAANTSTYSWTIPVANDVNGKPLRARNYYRFEVRGVYDSTSGNPPDCLKSAVGGRIVRPYVPVCQSLTADPRSGDKPLQVRFTGQVAPVASADYNYVYKFDFGDGEVTQGNQNVVNHSYTQAGNFTAKLYIIVGAQQSAEVASCVVTISVTEPDEKHMVCEDNSCVEVDGSGTNECDSNSDCEEDTHMACVNNSCDEVSGSGSDQCDSDADCEDDTHMVCRSNSCVEVSGSGSDECSQNQDCYTSGQASGGNDQNPVVPDTGSNDLQMYVFVALGLLFAGGLIFTRLK